MTESTPPGTGPKLLREDILRRTGESWALVGSRCSSGHVSFPPVGICPECLGSSVEPVELPKTGTIFAHTTVRMPAANFKPPYSIGYVELDGGPRIFAHFEVSPEQLKIGTRVELLVKSLWEEQGQPVIAYCFTTAKEATHA